MVNFFVMGILKNDVIKQNTVCLKRRTKIKNHGLVIFNSVSDSIPDY
mgnify:CR=1 FL=1